MITKTIIDVGFTKKYPMVVLVDEENPDVEVYSTPNDYSHLRFIEGLSDKEIMDLA